MKQLEARELRIGNYVIFEDNVCEVTMISKSKVTVSRKTKNGNYIKLCETGGRSLTMSVPPHETDFDMAVCELIRRYKEYNTNRLNKG